MEDLSWFPSPKSYKEKAMRTQGGFICRAFRTICRKAVQGCGCGIAKVLVEIRCFQKPNTSRASQNPCVSKQKSEDAKSLGASKKQQQKKVFSRATSWSHYLDNTGSKDDAVNALDPSKHYITDLSELFLGQKFASGSHSRLYHGFYKQQAVAVKLIMPPSEDEALSSRLDHQFSHEVALLSRLHHRNIVEFVSACKKPPVFCVIMEYLPGGSLKTFLHKTEPHSLSLEMVTSIALDTARGMEYLHSQGVIHRDLKSDNLIMTEDLHIKVADFGVSCLEAHRDNMKGYAGTYRWMAPEMIKEKPCSRKVDVYSFGIVLWELLTGLTPYEDMTPVQAAFAVCQKNARPAIPPRCPKEIAKLMRKCWSTNPGNRPEFSQVVKALQDFRAQCESDNSGG
eukprot:c21459_g1_i2 orf=859-2046(+)